MEITDIDIEINDDSDQNVKAYSKVTFDNTLTVKNFKLIDGKHGLFLAMPSKKKKKECSKCDKEIPRDAGYCQRCGKNVKDQKNRGKLYKSLVYTVQKQFKNEIEEVVKEEYEREKGRFGVPHQEDEDYDSLDFELPEESKLSDDSEEDESTSQKEAINTSPEPKDLFSDPEENLFKPKSATSVSTSSRSFGNKTVSNGTSKEGANSFNSYY